jgi:hypothetical protein
MYERSTPDNSSRSNDIHVDPLSIINYPRRSTLGREDLTKFCSTISVTWYEKRHLRVRYVEVKSDQHRATGESEADDLIPSSLKFRPENSVEMESRNNFSQKAARSENEF